jgi:hypothetical protein
MTNWRSSAIATLGTDVTLHTKKKRWRIINQNNGRGYSKDRHSDVAVTTSMIGQKFTRCVRWGYFTYRRRYHFFPDRKPFPIAERVVLSEEYNFFGCSRDGIKKSQVPNIHLHFTWTVWITLNETKTYDFLLCLSKIIILRQIKPGFSTSTIYILTKTAAEKCWILTKI